jgi:hypothetical protein
LPEIILLWSSRLMPPLPVGPNVKVTLSTVSRSSSR